jgi:hypothetical protein
MLSDSLEIANQVPFDNTSGMGPGAQVPPELLKWNWGAFFLNWVWAIGNDTYLGLLSFVPVIGFIVPFVLGVRGSRWAWQNRRWASVAEFQRVQRRWAQIALVLMALFLGAAGFVAYMFVEGYKNTDLYKEAVASVEDDDQLREEVGDPYAVKATSFNFIGTTASIDFDVTGPNGTTAVRVYLERIKGTWTVIDSVLLEDDTDDANPESDDPKDQRSQKITV